MNYISITDIDRRKKHAVIWNRKIISKHINFYHAQSAVDRHFKNNKIDNSYRIEAIPLEPSGHPGCEICGIDVPILTLRWEYSPYEDSFIEICENCELMEPLPQ